MLPTYRQPTKRSERTNERIGTNRRTNGRTNEQIKVNEINELTNWRSKQTRTKWTNGTNEWQWTRQSAVFFSK